MDDQKGGYAIGTFNIENMEMAQVIIMAAGEMNAPVIIQMPILHHRLVVLM